jgi:hypothetical protein
MPLYNKYFMTKNCGWTVDKIFFCKKYNVIPSQNVTVNVYCPSCNGAGSFRAILFVISGHAKEKIGVHFEPFVPEGGNILVHGKSKVI